MNPELREAIGRVLYEATVDLTSEYTPTWDWLLNKEEWTLRAEKVVEARQKWIDDNVGGYLKTAGIDEREDA
jgi:hypothetical protein